MPIEVVYIDDEPELCSLFQELYDSSEIHVRAFTDPFQALDHINQSPPDVVFLDYRMPGLNGIELAEKLASSIPKYLITGEVLALEHPAIETVLRKPYGCSQVQDILEGVQRLKSGLAS